MNKETLNLAIQKLNEAFQAIKPDAMDLGQQYVEYLVFKTEIALFSVLTFIIFCSTVLFILFKKRERYDVDIFISFLSILIFVFSVVAFHNIEVFITAHTFPLVYAIEKIAGIT